MKTKRAKWRPSLFIATMVAALVGSFAMPALAVDGFQVEIDISTVMHAPVGSITQLATEDVPAEFHGQTCQVESAVADNQQSTHPGNNLIVASGGTEVVLENVEDQPDGHVVADGLLTLGPTIVVSLQMGEDHTFSAGMAVTITCQPIPPSGYACIDGEVVFIPDATGFEGTLYETPEEAAADPNCAEEPPSGWACVNGEVVFIPDATGFEGTLYETPEEAAADVDCTEVLASTTFTISGTCAVTNGVGGFTISGNLGEGVTLQVAGQTLTETGAFSINVGSAGNYPYVVTLAEGFLLAEGSPAPEATISLVECTPTNPPDEVEDVEVLPLTGPDPGVLIPVALLSLGAGVAILATQRRREEV